MTTPVLLTVDTELIWRSCVAWGDWDGLYARSYDPAGVGIPFQLRLLARHDLKACFFVDPMPALVCGIDPIRRMVEPILEAGQEVQLHVHPNWTGAADWRTDHEFELAKLPQPRQQELVAQACDLIVRAGAPRPTAFRAGSFAADDGTLRALAALGITYDSSHSGSAAQCRIGLSPAQIAPIRHQGVIEVPVTQISEPGGGLRPLQVCAVSVREMAAALDHATGEGHAAVTIVSHSFELASRDGKRPNGTHLRRFVQLCAMLDEARDMLPTATFAELKGLPLDQDDAPLPVSGGTRALRQAEQLWSNLYDERRV